LGILCDFAKKKYFFKKNIDYMLIRFNLFDCNTWAFYHIYTSI
jgi:hypothetical protein